MTRPIHLSEIVTEFVRRHGPVPDYRDQPGMSMAHSCATTVQIMRIKDELTGDPLDANLAAAMYCDNGQRRISPIGSRHNPLRHIQVLGRRGHAEWVQRKPKPPKQLDCRKAQRRRRKK